ncbi:MAG: twin-arginine translocase subunit TatC [Peptococcaceae bacterium]|nr:twin-arginine translocase subunit TatC [Peptococcaceae bacterium]
MSGELMPLRGHLGELRKALVVSGLSLLASSFAIFLTRGDWLFQFLTGPVRSLDIPVISIRVTEVFMTKVKLSLLAGFVVSFPVMIAQIWGFLAPALTKKEKRMAAVIIPLAILLFAGGLFFAYFAVFPLAVRFLLLMTTEGLMPMITVGEYLSFTVSFFIPFGIAFEMPLAVYILGKLGIIGPAALAGKRKYAVLLVLAAAAVLTPGPDVVSQLMMAVPVYLLYEISIWVSFLVRRGNKGDRAVEAPV